MALYLPIATGRAALAELPRVRWNDLPHAYGTGRCGPSLHEDIAATLSRLADDFDEAIQTMFANLCHQGTIYTATAHAFPFLAAFAAGTPLTGDDPMKLRAIMVSIAVASSYDAKTGSHAGSWGEGVAALTRDAVRGSADHLAAMAEQTPSLRPLAETLALYVSTNPPDKPTVAKLEALRRA